MTALVPGTAGTGDLALGPLAASSGNALTGLRLRYRIIGNVPAARENGWILVFHALTGSAEVEQWWGPLVGPGKPLDTSRRCATVCIRSFAIHGYAQQSRVQLQGERPDGGGK